MRILPAALAAIFFSAFLSASAYAQTVCFPRPQVVKMLARNHQEAPVNMGTTNQGNMIEIFASDTGGWTAVITKPATGNSCLVGSGTGWTAVTQKPAGPGA